MIVEEPLYKGTQKNEIKRNPIISTKKKKK